MKPLKIKFKCLDVTNHGNGEMSVRIEPVTISKEFYSGIIGFTIPKKESKIFKPGQEYDVEFGFKKVNQKGG